MIAPCYRANLVLLPEDPLNFVGEVEFPAAVKLDGYWMDEIKLEEFKRSGPRHLARPICLASIANEALGNNKAMKKSNPQEQHPLGAQETILGNWI